MNMWALIPIKNFGDAKQRLSSVLNPIERRGLFEAMVKDVLEVVHCHTDLENTLIISDDPIARWLAETYGVRYLRESELKASGLNDVVQTGTDYLASQGVNDVMVIHGDLPLINSEEISNLIKIHKDLSPPAITIAPDNLHQGTNCMLCSSASRITFSYGEQSLQKHANQALSKGISLAVKSMSGISRDIDTPDDLLFLIDQPEKSGVASHTQEFISESGIREHIEQRVQPSKDDTQEANVSIDYPEAS